MFGKFALSIAGRHRSKTRSIVTAHLHRISHRDWRHRPGLQVFVRHRAIGHLKTISRSSRVLHFYVNQFLEAGGVIADNDAEGSSQVAAKFVVAVAASLP